MTNAGVRGLLPARSASAICLMLSLTGCERMEPAVPATATSLNAREFVTGNALTDLDDKGLFKTAGKATTSVGISPNRAREVAIAYAERFGSGLQRSLFREHGGQINFAALEAADRVYLAQTPYERLDDSAPAGLKKRFGPYYMVHLFEDGRPAIAAAVSVANEKLVEDEHGIIRFFAMVGEDVRLYGLRPDQPIPFPISPEEAVEVAYRATGLRAAEVPDLVLEPAPKSAFFARWRVTLEKPTTLAGSDGQAYVRNQVYVGFERKLAIGEAASQSARDARVGDVRGSLRFRPGMPARYVKVEIPNR